MKKILVFSLVVALVLVLLLPAVVVAKPAATFSATGTITGISPTVVGQKAFPLGQSGKWLVVNRDLTGVFAAGGSVAGAYTLTYGGVFDISTQAGNLTGVLKNGDNQFFVNARVNPLTFNSSGLPKLDITGHWLAISGVKAVGNFTAQLIFTTDTSGHITGVTGSFGMTGRYLNGNSDSAE